MIYPPPKVGSNLEAGGMLWTKCYGAQGLQWRGGIVQNCPNSLDTLSPRGPMEFWQSFSDFGGEHTLRQYSKKWKAGKMICFYEHPCTHSLVALAILKDFFLEVLQAIAILDHVLSQPIGSLTWFELRFSTEPLELCRMSQSVILKYC